MNAPKLLVKQSNQEEASCFLQKAIELLSTISLRSLKHADKQHVLEEFAGLTSIATATALNIKKTPYYALELLELGRALFLVYYQRRVRTSPLLSVRIANQRRSLYPFGMRQTPRRQSSSSNFGRRFTQELLYGRRPNNHKLERLALEDALLVSMRKTPDKAVLRFALSEVEMLEDLCPLLQVVSHGNVFMPFSISIFGPELMLLQPE